jgi:DNA-directed RNA polymerase specialized sigma24 family protein
MTPEARRLLHALLERVGARMDDLDRRFDALERVVFTLDDLEARVARLEQRPPTPLGGRELQRQRVEAVLRVRAEGFSHRQIARATGVSQAGVRRILLREGDPSSRMSGGQRQNGYGASSNGGGRDMRS